MIDRKTLETPGCWTEGLQEAYGEAMLELRARKIGVPVWQ
jgi:hypothetical protein